MPSCSKLVLLYPWPKDEKAAVGQCVSCGQLWTDREKQSEDAVELVKWHKFHQNAEIDKMPSGRLCYKCFDTDRSHFGSMPQTELDDARRESEKLNEKFCELRQNKVRGVKQKEIVDVKEFLQDEEEEFSEEAPEEGVFYSIVDFCTKFADNHVFENLAQRREFIERSGYEVVKDKKGKEGVEVMDYGPGSYRFRRGTKSSKNSEEENRCRP